MQTARDRLTEAKDKLFRFLDAHKFGRPMNEDTYDELMVELRSAFESMNADTEDFIAKKKAEENAPRA